MILECKEKKQLDEYVYNHKHMETRGSVADLKNKHLNVGTDLLT